MPNFRPVSDKLLAEAAKDIDITLVEIPDSSLAIDWSRLCREMAGDLSIGPEKTLANLDDVRQQILKAGNARLFLISSLVNTADVGGVDSESDRGPGQSRRL